MIELIIHFKEIKKAGVSLVYICLEMHNNKALGAPEREVLKQF